MIAWSAHRLAQQRRTASRTASAPRTHKNVSYCPAQLASGESSASALDRTATAASGQPTARQNSSYAAVTADATDEGTRVSLTMRRISAPRAATTSGSPFSLTSAASTARRNPPRSSSASKASVVTTNPGGTGAPARVIAASAPHLPPSLLVPDAAQSSNATVYGGLICSHPAITGRAVLPPAGHP